MQRQRPEPASPASQKTAADGRRAPPSAPRITAAAPGRSQQRPKLRSPPVQRDVERQVLTIGPAVQGLAARAQ